MSDMSDMSVKVTDSGDAVLLMVRTMMNLGLMPGFPNLGLLEFYQKGWKYRKMSRG